MKKVFILFFAALFAPTLFPPGMDRTSAVSFEKPNLQLSVMSDVHISKNFSNNKFQRALIDLENIAPNYDAIAIVGDFTDAGYEEDYQKFNSILNTYKNPMAERFIVMGNHEYYESLIHSSASITDDMLKKRFMDYNGNPISSIYYDKWINGYHFISLAGELSAKSLLPYENNYPGARDWAYISEEQYQWLERTLPINAVSNKPIFVFLHQPIANTVYGSIRWNAGFDSQRLLTILKKYPQAILISGHSHYLLNHPKSIYQDGFTMVNTGSVEYVWYEEGTVPVLSQGYLINVYDDRVEFKAREFSNGTWIRTVTLPIPFRESAKDVSKPSFTGSSTINMNEIGTTTASISWDPGKDNTVIDRYLIKKEGQLIQTVYPRFWIPGERVTASVNNLFPNTAYTFEIYAVDAYDNVSLNPLKFSFTTQRAKGWFQHNKTWYYFNNEGVKHTGWLADRSHWYYFDQLGVMQTGWIFINGKWYYFNKTGEMKTGWLEEDSKWYFLDKSGAMHTGWLFNNNKWYFLDSNGVLKTGWISSQNYWYYLDGNGVMKTGWLSLGNYWYYLKSDGKMVTGWHYISGKWYYFSASGQWQK